MKVFVCYQIGVIELQSYVLVATPRRTLTNENTLLTFVVAARPWCVGHSTVSAAAAFLLAFVLKNSTEVPNDTRVNEVTPKKIEVNATIVETIFLHCSHGRN